MKFYEKHSTAKCNRPACRALLGALSSTDSQNGTAEEMREW